MTDNHDYETIKLVASLQAKMVHFDDIDRRVLDIEHQAKAAALAANELTNALVVLGQISKEHDRRTAKIEDSVTRVGNFVFSAIGSALLGLVVYQGYHAGKEPQQPTPIIIQQQSEPTKK